MNWKGFAKKRLLPSLGSVSWHLPVECDENTKDVSPDICCTDRDWNRTPAKYESTKESQ
jgi:hypothetical protein